MSKYVHEAAVPSLEEGKGRVIVALPFSFISFGKHQLSNQPATEEVSVLLSQLTYSFFVGSDFVPTIRGSLI